VQPYSHATKKTSAPLSPSVVIHLHGGGYVAQSPQSHAVS
jgi:acetyl esterase/lipase